jgi:hypothetical protein
MTTDFKWKWNSRFNVFEIPSWSGRRRKKASSIEHISDIPRDKQVGFFRIKLPEDIPIEIVSEIAEDCMVNISLDGERHLQVSGKRECVRDARKKLGQLFYGESKLE